MNLVVHRLCESDGVIVVVPNFKVFVGVQVIEAAPHQIKIDKMQYMKVEPSRLPTTNVLVQSLNF